MRYTVRHIHFVGVVVQSSEQGSRLRDVSVREGRPMPTHALVVRQVLI